MRVNGYYGPLPSTDMVLVDWIVYDTMNVINLMGNYFPIPLYLLFLYFSIYLNFKAETGKSTHAISCIMANL